MKNDELKHYGVKGMKWGVRKDRNDTNKMKMDKKRKTGKAVVRRYLRKGKITAQVIYDNTDNAAMAAVAESTLAVIGYMKYRKLVS